MNKKIFFAFLISFFSQILFAQINVLSPIEGQWANKQMLVIETEKNSEYFYSIDGSDPEKIGFAYDGPVLLDVTGDVIVKIVQISRGKKQNVTINYNVELDNAYGTSYKTFVQTFFDSGIINYSTGANFYIPENLQFSLGLPPDSYLQGTTLVLDSNCVLQRTVPCVIFDSQKNVKYRFVIKIFPQSPGEYTRKDVPFSITDWETISFNDQNLLYKIDSEFWSLPKESRKIDRSVSHMLSWQSINYEEGNPIEFFVLPPKPELQKSAKDDGSFSYNIQSDDSYTLGIKDSNSDEYSSLYKTIIADCFIGERTSGEMEIGVFANGVYQGNLVETYKIDKRPPVIPTLTTNATSFYSREKVDIEITSEKDCELYIALSSPINLQKTETPYTPENEVLTNIKVGEFQKVNGNSFKVSWSQRGASPAFYKVQAYSKSGKNISEILEYSAIVDQQNFYLDCTGTAAENENAEGTEQYPFTTFEQLAKALKKNTITTVRVKGDVIIDKSYDIPSKIEIINEGESTITFLDGACLCLKNATVTFTDFIIKNDDKILTEQIIPLIKAENSVLTLHNCMIDTQFPTNATIIDGENSIINIINTIASVTAKEYASFISSQKSRLTVLNSSISVNSSTSVVISASKGNATLQNSSFSATGSTIRIAQLAGVKADVTNNKFTLHSLPTTFAKKNKKTQPLYTNKSTVLLEKDNEIIEY